MKTINFRTNRPLMIAVSASFIYFGVGHFIRLPELLKEFLLGVSLVGYALGIYAIHHDIRTIQNVKKRMIHRLAGR